MLIDINLFSGQFLKAQNYAKVLYGNIPSKMNCINLANVQFYFDINSGLNTLKDCYKKYGGNEINAFISSVYVSTSNMDSANKYLETYILNGTINEYVLEKTSQDFIEANSVEILIKHILKIKNYLSDETINNLENISRKSSGSSHIFNKDINNIQG